MSGGCVITGRTVVGLVVAFTVSSAACTGVYLLVPGEGTAPNSAEPRPFVTEPIAVDPSATGVSPDGRRLARPRVVTPDLLGTAEAMGAVEVTDLETGAVRSYEVPHSDPFECRTDGVALAPDGRHLAVVTGCATYGREVVEITDEVTWLEELDLETGAWRTIESVPGSLPSETSPAYSPDGTLVAFGIGIGFADAPGLSEGEVRVTEVATGRATMFSEVILVREGAWQDDRTLLAMADVLGGYALLDVVTGETRPVG